MAEKSLDDDVMAKIEARDRATRRMIWFLLAPAVLLAVAFAAAFVTGQTALLQSQTVQIVIGALFAACILFVVLRLGRQFRPDISVAAADPRIIRRRIDAHHRTLRTYLCIGIVSTVPSLLGLRGAFNRLEHVDRFLALVVAGATILSIAAFLVPLIIGPGGWLDRERRDILNDEFMRALRARAMRLGYLTTIVAVVAALIATLWRVDLAVPSLAWALYAGFAIPALYDVIADWRASRDNG